MNTARHNLLLLETMLHSSGGLLKGCGNFKVHHPSPRRVEDALPARHHSMPQWLLRTPSSLAHPSSSTPLPQTAAGDIPPPASGSPCSSWQAEQHSSFSGCLNQRSKSCTHR